MLKVPSSCASFSKRLLLLAALCFAPLSFAQQAETSHQASQQASQSSTDAPIPGEPTQITTPVSTASTSNTSSPINSHDLTPWGMYKNADVVVKAVMIGLLLASLLTWTIFVAKLTELLGAKKRLRQEINSLKKVSTLLQAKEMIKTLTPKSLASLFVNDIQEELDLSAGSTSSEGIKERASFRQNRLVADCGRRMNTGTSILATIGAVSPFIGLFGTVWGIMNSFIGIAESQTTNLAVVAPGIAEALLATAMGLVAAIPAVIIYNVFTRSISHYRIMVSDISAQTLLLLSRDLDRKDYTTTH